MPSAVWSSLTTLESVAPYVSLPPDEPKTYQPLANLRQDDVKHRFLHQRQQKLCTSIALITASSPDAQTVTACCAEILLHEKQLSVILRLAQNQVITEADKQGFQNLIESLVWEVFAKDEAIWSDRESTFCHQSTIE